MAILWIIDDQPAILSGLKIALEDTFQVYIFTSATDFLAALDTIRPDIVLTDFKMAEIDGLELTRLIKQRYPKVPVILYSSALSPDLVKAACQAGVQICLDKPFDLDELIEILNKLVEPER